MITAGILVPYLVAVVVLVALPNNAGNLDWRLILGIGALSAIQAEPPDAGPDARRCGRGRGGATPYSI